MPIAENVNKFARDNIAFTIFTIIVGLLPSILKYYKAKFFPKDCENFFIQLMKRAYSLRNADGLERTDIMDHLLKIRETHSLKDFDLYAHTMTFLIDGLDTTATVISHCLLMVTI